MSLPPCHVLYQATANEEGELELQLYQRSCDQFLGVPFNIASYAALTQIIAQEADMVPKTFIHTFGDAHFYTSIGKRTQWYKANFKEVQQRIRNVSQREEYLDVVDWLNKNAPVTAMKKNMIMSLPFSSRCQGNPGPCPNCKLQKSHSTN